MFIRSERLFLRPAWPEDVSELDTLMDEALARHASRMPWLCRRDDGRMAADLVAASRHPQFVITLPDGQGAGVVGMVGFAECDGATGLGMWIGRDWRNRDFATEAARAALSLARALGHCMVVASHFADDAAAACVLAKLGFVPTGQIGATPCAARGPARPSLRYALRLCPSASDPADPQAARRAA